MQKPFAVALLWPGDADARRTATLEASRLARVAEALRDAGMNVQPAVYHEDFVNEVRTKLLGVDAVLVWVNPIEQGRDRTQLNALLRDVAAAGVLVSAHPDVIDKIGTKQVLYDTRHMAWGGDTRLYRSLDALRSELPIALCDGDARVLKRCRGNGGDGVWKVRLADGSRVGLPSLDAPVDLRHAARGSSELQMPLSAAIEQLAPYFDDGGTIIDQAYEARLTDGMVRCYLAGGHVVGFGEQLINALYPAPDGAPAGAAPQPGSRLYYPPSRADFQLLKRQLESDWLPELCATMAIEPDALPAIWDADFLYGPKAANGADTYVLCEINVSCVFPFPDDALAPLAEQVGRTLAARRGSS